MPLSEHEQRLLEEMERSLYNNDADFVATVSPRGARPNYRRIALGALIAWIRSSKRAMVSSKRSIWHKSSVSQAASLT